MLIATYINMCVLSAAFFINPIFRINVTDTLPDTVNFDLEPYKSSLLCTNL